MWRVIERRKTFRRHLDRDSNLAPAQLSLLRLAKFTDRSYFYKHRAYLFPSSKFFYRELYSRIAYCRADPRPAHPFRARKHIQISRDLVELAKKKKLEQASPETFVFVGR